MESEMQAKTDVEQTHPAEDDPFEENPLLGVRLQNLQRLLGCFPTQAEFCRATGSSAAVVAQFLRPDRMHRSWRPVSRAFARRIEQALGLPRTALDQEQGVESHLEEVVERVLQAGFMAAMPGLALPRKRTHSSPPALVAPLASSASLKPLHAAALESFHDALLAGRISDQECLRLMQGWLPQEPEPVKSA